MNVENTPFLSIVIPAHNEEHRLPPTLEKIDQYLRSRSLSAEGIVVENGSSDRTADVTTHYAETHPYVKLLVVETRGKGLAVKAGMLVAQGDYRFMCDADLSMPIDELDKFITPEMQTYDLILGSREAQGARRIDEPEYRHIMGRVLNTIVKLTAVNQFEDTQCGFKLFSRKAADDLFHIQRMNGIGFDVELVFLAVKRGYKIYEMPITWYFDADSRMKLFKDTLHILQEIWEIRRNWQQGVYDAPTP